MFKKTFIILAVLGAMIPTFVFAQYGLDAASQGTGLIKPVNSQEALPSLIGSIVGMALSFVGAIFFFLVLYAGFTWMTAFGNSEKVDKAKSIMEHAAVGLVIVLAAYAISRFVFSSLAGISGNTASTDTVVVHTPGTRCVPDGDFNNIWDSAGTQCVTKCEYNYPGKGVCKDKSGGCAQPYVSGICPGADVNFQCCPSEEGIINI